MMINLTETILESARSGDRQAIATLVRSSHRQLRAFVASLLLDPNDVDDVAQEVFLRALERLDKVDRPESLAAFLRGIARNVVRERRRKFAREENAFTKLVIEKFDSDSTATNANLLSDPETLKALQECMRRIPERSRKMLTMRYEEELNSDQIGGQFSLSAPAVRAALKRAREALLNCLRSSCPTAGEVV